MNATQRDQIRQQIADIEFEERTLQFRYLPLVQFKANDNWLKETFYSGKLSFVKSFVRKIYEEYPVVTFHVVVSFAGESLDPEVMILQDKFYPPTSEYFHE